MTLTSTTPKEIKLGNGVTTVFSFGFVVNKAADLVVTHVTSAGVETTLTEGTGTSNYSISVAAYPGTGSVTYPATLGTELATGEKLVLSRVVDIDQDTDLINQGSWKPEQVEGAFDYSRMVDLQQQEQIDRSIKAPISSPTGIDYELPAPVANAVVAIWNATADAMVAGPTASAISGAQAQAVASAASAAAALVSEAAALVSENNAAASEAIALAATVGKYGAKISLTAADSPYTLATMTLDTLINVNTSAGSVIIDLPQASGEDDNRLVGINKIGATNTVTVNSFAGDTIGGAASFVQYDDTEWSDLYLNKTITDWQLGNLSYTSAGTGLEKTGSTIGIAASGVNTTQLADNGVTPPKVSGTINKQTGTTYTLALTDAFNMVTCSNAAAVTLTVPLNAVIAFTEGDRIDLVGRGAGLLTVTGATGVTINDVSAGSATLTAQFSAASLEYEGADSWLLIGDHGGVA